MTYFDLLKQDRLKVENGIIAEDILTKENIYLEGYIAALQGNSMAGTDMKIKRAELALELINYEKCNIHACGASHVLYWLNNADYELLRELYPYWNNTVPEEEEEDKKAVSKKLTWSDLVEQWDGKNEE